jgi:hypothetical protein
MICAAEREIFGPRDSSKENAVSITDYVVDILLILVIFRAVRPHPLTLRAALLPLILLAVAGIIYLRPVTLRGNDLALILILAAVGIVLGVISGLADRIWRDEHQQLMSRAVTVSVLAWIIGMGFRFWFAYYAYHGGGPAVARFSVQHDLSGANIWTTALVLMAFGQVLARLAVLQIRRVRAASELTVAAQVPAPRLASQAADRAPALVPALVRAHEDLHARRHERIAARRAGRRERRAARDFG